MASMVFNVMYAGLTGYYKLTPYYSAHISAFIACFLWTLWRKKISEAELFIFCIFSFWGGTGEELFNSLLLGNYTNLLFYLSMIFSVIIGSKTGIVFVNKEERKKTVKSKVYITVYAIYLNYAAIFILENVSMNPISFFVFTNLIILGLGFLITVLLKRINNIILLLLFIFSPRNASLVFPQVIKLNIYYLYIFIITLLSLYIGVFIAKILLKLMKVKKGI